MTGHILHQYKMKGMFDFLWMKHSTASGTSHAVSTKIKAFLKTGQNPFPSQISQGHTDIGAGTQLTLGSVFIAGTVVVS